MTPHDMCPVCPRRHTSPTNPSARNIHGARIQLVKPTGPTPAPVMFVGDAPDSNANRTGVAMVGKLGREFDDCYLPAAQLHREDVYTTYAMKCQRADCEPPTPGEARACAQFWLPRELAAVNPRTVVAMGATAARALLTPQDADRVDVDAHHGQLYGRVVYERAPELDPHTGAPGWWWHLDQPPVMNTPGLHLVVVNSPSSGFAGSDLMTDVLGDFRALRGVLDSVAAGRYPHMIDTHPFPQYYELTTAEQVWAALDPVQSLTRGRWVAVDTETDGNGGPPWCLSFSTAPGTGYVVPVDAPDAVRAVRAYVTMDRYIKVLLHNAMFDLGILALMGVDGFQWRDTMHTAYQLGNQPQGLKPLAWRLCGMEMVDYNEVVQGPSIPPVLEWGARTLAAIDRALPTKQPRKKLQYLPMHTEWKKQGLLLAKRLTRLGWYTAGGGPVPPVDYSKLITSHKPAKRKPGAADPVAPVDFPSPWDWWADREHGARATLGMFGGCAMPQQSIVHVERGRAVQYAARDADATLRTWVQLRKLVRHLVNIVGPGMGKPSKTW